MSSLGVREAVSGSWRAQAASAAERPPITRPRLPKLAPASPRRCNRLMSEASPAAPAIIMNAPQLAENIGAAARVMANFGLDDLRLVNPRDGWPQERAWA